MPSLSPQLLLVPVGTWLAWRVWKYLFGKNPLSIISGPPTDSILTGNMMNIFTGTSSNEAYIDNLAKTYGSLFKIHALFNADLLYTYDSKALQHIVLKDQHIWEEPEDFIILNGITFGAGLLATLGDHHRKQRKILNPVFSIAHMRDMTPTFYSIGRKLRDSLTKLNESEKEIDMLPWLTRCALELIGQSGFGYSFDTLEIGAPEHRFGHSMKNYTAALNDTALVICRFTIMPIIHNWGSRRFQRAVVDFLPWKALHEVRDMVDVMHSTSVEIFEKTKQAIKEGGIAASERVGGGKDIMSVLVKANMLASEEDRLPDNELIGQVSTLTFAAMDTTSNALARILHLLATHQDVQDKLRKEIREAHFIHGEELDYESLTALPYLDAICRETLRLHAPVPILMRVATQDAILPLANPIKSTDGRLLHEVLVPKGTSIFISPHHCNRDPAIWGPDATEWKPERWLSPLPESLVEARVPGVYSHLMTFLGGSRSCIGFKFAQLEMKVILSLLVERFQINLGDKKIIWLSNGIVQPSTEDAPVTSGRKETQIPLVVSLAA
ncbi:hypothetical protein D9611_009907 [Ephemerocybe angulata]|uniref:Cytochrome P450 n=1 Tax=Ephemerocybe angulata TaxID=980116 RepID=A0A8H5FJE6_9AGAR|nr:hypothetical protein D9611_009907 [Tulosesus angulatus]